MNRNMFETCPYHPSLCLPDPIHRSQHPIHRCWDLLRWELLTAWRAPLVLLALEAVLRRGAGGAGRPAAGRRRLEGAAAAVVQTWGAVLGTEYQGVWQPDTFDMLHCIICT